jgi:capsule polysaccharide export protein KpsE/RkpR
LGVLASLPGVEAFSAAVPSDVQRIQAVLTSNSVSDEVIAKFKLQERYGTSHIEHTRLALREHCITNVDRKSNLVDLTCEDTVPEDAMAMAAYYGEVGNRIFARISASSAHEERKFLEAQVGIARTNVDESSRKLREFQEQHHVVDLGEQSKAVISAMASLEGELVSKQLQLSYLRGFSSPTESSIVQLQQQIGIMEAKLKQLENSQPTVAVLPPAGSATGPDAKFFPDAIRLPQLRFELEQLLREQKIHETVFLLMTQRFETARVDEARDTSTFQILDSPTLPTYRSRPKRRTSALFGLAGGLGGGVALLLLLELRRQQRAPKAPKATT